MIRHATAGMAMAAACVLAGCGHSPEPPAAPSSPVQVAELRLGVAGEDDAATFPPRTPLGLQALLPTPEENRLTAERVDLGRRLFFDPVLSGDSTVSCASCHRPALAFADSVRRSPGVEGRTGTRITPSLVNRGYGSGFFWDGRAPSLEEAVLLPIENPRELDLAMDSLVLRLEANPGYRVLFARAYPEGRPAAAGERAERGRADGERADEGRAAASHARGDGSRSHVSRWTIGAALASYVRLIRSGGSPVDRFAAGDTAALFEAAVRGRRLFLGPANCTACHSGPNFADESFHVTGVAHGSGDPGRAAVTGRKEDGGAFKTPTLREVARTAPYMHDGSLATLEEVVHFYDRGGLPHPNLSPDIEPLGLSDREVADLVAFLESLSGRVEAPGPAPP